MQAVLLLLALPLLLVLAVLARVSVALVCWVAADPDGLMGCLARAVFVVSVCYALRLF